MPITELPIYNGFYVNRSLPVSAQQCSNLYVYPVRSGLSDFVLYGTPGLRQIASTGGRKQGNRGAHVKEGIPYYVNGNSLWRLNRSVTAGVETFSVTELGTVEGTGRVSMADNGTQLVVQVPGGKGYVYNEAAATPFVEITDADFRANGEPQYVEYIDGYFVFSTDSKKFIVSALNDALSYNALDFASAEADPDDIVAPIVNRNQLYIGGSETIEIFQNIGGADFPFQRVQGGVIPKGVFAPSSIVKASDENFYFIGGAVNESANVLVCNGTQAAPVSTDGIARVLQNLTAEELNSVFGFSYGQAGAQFVGWVLPTTCIVYEINTGLWHERKSLITDLDGTNNTRWRVNSLLTAYGRVLVGDSQDGRIGSLDLDFYDEYDTDIIRDIGTLPFSNQAQSVSFAWMELTMESGVGDDDTPEPLVTMDRSLDGKTYTAARTRSFGRRGQYRNRVVWRRGGRAERFEIFRFSISSRVKVVIAKLEADVMGGV